MRVQWRTNELCLTCCELPQGSEKGQQQKQQQQKQQQQQQQKRSFIFRCEFHNLQKSWYAACELQRPLCSETFTASTPVQTCPGYQLVMTQADCDQSPIVGYNCIGFVAWVIMLTYWLFQIALQSHANELMSFVSCRCHWCSKAHSWSRLASEHSWHSQQGWGCVTSH